MEWLYQINDSPKNNVAPWLTPICDPVSEFLEFPIWDIIFFPHPVKEHLLRKHRKNCESCPTQVTWKVKFICQFVIGSFRNSCDVFDRVEYFCGSRLQMSSYPVPVTSTYKFSCQIGQAKHPLPLSSQPKKRWPKRFTSKRRTFVPFMTSWLQAL